MTKTLNILHSLLRRPIAVTMTLIAVVTLGVLALRRIPVSLMPDIDVPRIVVQMSAQGCSAREIEQRMVGPMRLQLSQIAGLKNIESTSRTDAGVITLTFSPGSDMSLLFIEVNEKIDRAMVTMPKEMERPRVMKTGALDIPAFYIDVTGGRPEQTSRLVSSVISKRMEQLPEVAMVDYSGLARTQVIIQPDATCKALLGITDADIEKAISDNNIVLEALSVRDGIYRYSIHFDSQILSANDIGNIYIRHDGRLLQLKDICKIEETAAIRKGFVMSNDKDAVTMAVIKQSDAQMSDLKQSVDTLLSQLSHDYPALHFSVTRDQTQLLSYSMNSLAWNLALGIIMASVVLFVFIGGWKLSVLVAMSIPLSLILTLLCFYLLGISLNIISLSGLILGVGMIVDNAIIVIDNILQKNVCNEHTVCSAVKEVFMPMLSSVLTTCSVFVPLIFLSGTAGALFYDQAMGITIALFCSLAVATLVIPVYHFVFCQNCRPKASMANKRMVKLYEEGMHYTLRHPKIMVSAFSGCILLVVFMLPFIRKERMPKIPHDDTLITIDWNEGIVPEENNRRVKEVLDHARDNIKVSTSMVGGQDFLLPHTKNITSSEAVCYIKCESDEDCDSVVEKMQRYIYRHYPKARVEIELAANIFDMIFSMGEPDLQIRLQKRNGDRPEVLQTHILTDSLRRIFPDKNILNVPTEIYIRYRADAEHMAYYGVTYKQLYSRLKELLGANNIYEINSGGETVPIVVDNGRIDSETLLGNTITNSMGTDIPLAYLVKESRCEDYKYLVASDDGEYSVIDIDHIGDRKAEKIMEYVEKVTSDTPVKASFRGGYFSSRSMLGEMMTVLTVALLLLFFILAAQFESLVQPLIILAEVVIDVAMVMLALFVFGESLNIMSMIGIVVACGIIINDSILKVDTINRLYRRNGSENSLGNMPLIRAIVVAGHMRFKPIVMTSLTTVLAILPFLYHGDMGSALQYPLSFTIIVGMAVGTMVSLFFVPLVYYIIYRKR